MAVGVHLLPDYFWIFGRGVMSVNALILTNVVFPSTVFQLFMKYSPYFHLRIAGSGGSLVAAILSQPDLGATLVGHATRLESQNVPHESDDRPLN